ncbi:dTDP-4-dehydro-6-deoxy-D-glucose transaminase [Vibrio crassostreae]|nr:dTDP-4-dehydro-6-deoxy-D-glucose transaminase [Vibrio crassostreae]CAK2313955.1 dTDP-4-dehydro-6-deoxy-D-glucose transaminase [Vibrio crassostreae]CAK2451103.1 dTDP-4-dehydro-6-deoxy-D-glucose transaminase [Vibrio crassostreae]CAK2771142.1 dTDP-4-dehydro-6-deoxy-D-glucose transaminase [Vibrio crassostreae]
MIPFNKPPVTGDEVKYITQAIKDGKLCGDNTFGLKCQGWFEEKFGAQKTLITPSCTHALELAAMLIGIEEGDEIIMPSYTFVSTANAFVLRGAKIVFVDIRKDTMNIDESLIENAITRKTKAIVPVHYAGVACEMDKIMDIAKRYKLFVIEDAAQGVMSTYKGRALGTIGHLGAFSFHETKNYTSGGEGGLLVINDNDFISRAEIIREKGTNRSQFHKGMVDKYSWVDIGSSLLPSELQSAYLWGQLERAKDINEKRLKLWYLYFNGLKSLELSGYINLPHIPNNVEHNAHMFYIKTSSEKLRKKLIEFLNFKGIASTFHYIPLHSSKFGVVNTTFSGEDNITTSESNKLLRLPIFYNMKIEEVEYVIDAVVQFFLD